MCGIVGYIGSKDATAIILNGLRKLEYRGYDSAGIAVYQDGKIVVKRDAGKLDNLVEKVRQEPVHGNVGIGHTRWATHGVPNEQNAHPHLSSNGDVVIVHNGIVENFRSLKNELQSAGVKFRSETDTETIVQLIEKVYHETESLEEAVTMTLARLKGAHGIVVMSAWEPEKIIAARIGNAGGVVIGLGENENFVASDIPAILEHTRQMIFLESGQMAVVTSHSVNVTTLEGLPVKPQVSTIGWDPIAAEKGEYRHFMQKEMFEQVRSLTDTLAGRVDFEEGRIYLEELNLELETCLQNKENIHNSLRNSFSCRDRRQNIDRKNCTHPGGGTHCIGVPLRGPDPGWRHRGSGNQSKWRDSRYTCSDGRGSQTRRRHMVDCERDWFTGNAHCGWIYLHASWSRNWRGQYKSIYCTTC